MNQAIARTDLTPEQHLEASLHAIKTFEVEQAQVNLITCENPPATPKLPAHLVPKANRRDWNPLLQFANYKSVLPSKLLDEQTEDQRKLLLATISHNLNNLEQEKI